MHIALLLGSFNPIHRGHIAIANWAFDAGVADVVWIVPTPHNPLKTTDQLASWNDRVAMIELAIGGLDHVELCIAESALNAPYYTINLVELLRERYAQHTFSILCGSDIESELVRWHRIVELRRMVDFIVYPRGGKQGDLELYDQNSTAIRAGEDPAGIDPEVLSYIEHHGLYFASPVIRARVAFSAGQFPDVINLALSNPNDVQLEQMAIMAREILDFRHTDIYNP